MSGVTMIECGECGGFFARLDRDAAECVDCGKRVSVSADVRPNMGEGEVLVWTVSGDLLGYTTIEGGE